jgi:2-oxoglutarate/2-oxoacid ferredoxin oxidoreductase subunit alpha
MSEPYAFNFSDDVSIVLAGPAGLGINTIEGLVSRILRLAGYNVFSTSEFMSRIRGGSNSTEIRVSSLKIATYVDKMDVLVPLDAAALRHCEKRISPKTLVLGERDLLGGAFPIVDIPFAKTAQEAGGKIYSSSVAVGVVCALFGVPGNLVSEHIKGFFGTKKPDIAEKNADAARRGHELGSALVRRGVVSISVTKDPSVKDELFLSGSDAVGLGALSAGCDFVSSYPMSPSTNVLTFLAEHKNEFGIVVEQAEDEISAVNMALGAWYAGARALATTSGGGFALMTEGISLSGMLETPVVVHVGQRPGPATGLPTRTEQADLDLVLYAGHGEFPRAVFAPGTLATAIEAVQRAFTVADKYQIPAFVLTDQYFLDSNAAMQPPDLSKFTVRKHIQKTGADYKRYALTESGLSPRGVPGYGDGIVCVDSDEHTEEGYITEDLDLRTRMVDKRFGKVNWDADDLMPPRFVGPDSLTNLVVCWGSNYFAVREALIRLGWPDTAMLHVAQVHPLHPMVDVALAKAKRVFVVENNATGQLARLLKVRLGYETHEHILKYNGVPFSVEELVEKIGKAIGKSSK